jgi:hypothetical protein
MQPVSPVFQHRENDHQRWYQRLTVLFTNGLIHGAMTALLEDGVREDAARMADGKTRTVEIPWSLFAVYNS